MRMGSDDHPSVWRSAAVTLGLMGVAPTDVDVLAAVAGESQGQAAAPARPRAIEDGGGRGPRKRRRP